MNTNNTQKNVEKEMWESLFSVLSHRPYRRVFVFAAKAGDIIKYEIHGVYVDGRITIGDSADRITVKEDGTYLVYGTEASSETAFLKTTFAYKTLERGLSELGESVVHFGRFKGTLPPMVGS